MARSPGCRQVAVGSPGDGGRSTTSPRRRLGRVGARDPIRRPRRHAHTWPGCTSTGSVGGVRADHRRGGTRRPRATPHRAAAGRAPPRRRRRRRHDPSRSPTAPGISSTPSPPMRPGRDPLPADPRGRSGCWRRRCWQQRCSSARRPPGASRGSPRTRGYGWPWRKRAVEDSRLRVPPGGRDDAELAAFGTRTCSARRAHRPPRPTGRRRRDRDRPIVRTGRGRRRGHAGASRPLVARTDPDDETMRWPPAGRICPAPGGVVMLAGTTGCVSWSDLRRRRTAQSSGVVVLDERSRSATRTVHVSPQARERWRVSGLAMRPGPSAGRPARRRWRTPPWPEPVKARIS